MTYALNACYVCRTYGLVTQFSLSLSLSFHGYRVCMFQFSVESIIFLANAWACVCTCVCVRVRGTVQSELKYTIRWMNLMKRGERSLPMVYLVYTMIRIIGFEVDRGFIEYGFRCVIIYGYIQVEIKRKKLKLFDNCATP